MQTVSAKWWKHHNRTIRSCLIELSPLDGKWSCGCGALEDMYFRSLMKKESYSMQNIVIANISKERTLHKGNSNG